MNARADNINGLVEHQMVVRFSPNLAERVNTEFLAGDPMKRPAFEIVWNDERTVGRFSLFFFCFVLLFSSSSRLS
jgi:hypothetical protein